MANCLPFDVRSVTVHHVLVTVTLTRANLVSELEWHCDDIPKVDCSEYESGLRPREADALSSVFPVDDGGRAP
jgi:hypothetical protein